VNQLTDGYGPPQVVMGANYGRTMWPLAAVDRCNLVGFGFGCEFGGEFGYGDLDFETDTVIEEKIICTSEIGKTGWTRIHNRFLRSAIRSVLDSLDQLGFADCSGD